MPDAQIWNTAAESKDFREFLKDPSIPKREKQASLDAVLGELKVGELTHNFMGESQADYL